MKKHCDMPRYVYEGVDSGSALVRLAVTILAFAAICLAVWWFLH